MFLMVMSWAKYKAQALEQAKPTVVELMLDGQEWFTAH